MQKNIYHQIKILIENTRTEEIKSKFKFICLLCFINKNNGNSLFREMCTNYRIINKMSECLFIDDWTIKDELRFIDAVGKLGLENWYDISSIIGKGILECRNHYYSFYYKSKNDYLPSDNLLLSKKHKTNINNINNNNINFLSYNNNIFFKKKLNRSNRTLRPNRHRKFENNEGDRDKTIITPNNFLGYNSKRKEFEYQYDNEAELEMSEIEFEENDKKEMKDMYYKIFENYNEIIKKREERENFIDEKGLIDIKKQIALEKKLSKDDKEIYNSLKQILKYLTLDEYNKLYQGIVLNKNIKMRIKQLSFFKDKGCSTHEDIHNYIVDLRKNNNKKGDTDDNNNCRKLRISLRDMSINLNDKSTTDE